jgi:ATP phosphoribosyltransferase regulatory subunit
MQRGTTRKFSTTPGTRDILPPESTRLLDVQARILERFRLHGFGEVITPALEYSEVVEEPKLRDASFKLFDPDNQMLLLRPEMTSPIARLVAQRLRNAPAPHKLSYALPVYRRTGVGRGQSAEFHQAGVEVVGATSPGEDAGTIALLIETLESLGLRAPRDFVLVLGQTAFYEGYLRRVAPDLASELLEALAAKDLVRVDEISANVTVEAAGVREIPRLVGPATDASVLERATRYAEGEAAAALDNLRIIMAHLDAGGGHLDSVMLDLGLIGRHNYYTGAVYEVYATGLGFTVANGGRYDNLLRRFGEPLPATGFAISLERLISVLPKEGPSPLLVLVGSTVEAIRLAAELRSSGVPVLHLAEDLAPEAAVGYARSVEASCVGYPAPDGLELAPAEPGGRFELTATEKVFERLLS